MSNPGISAIIPVFNKERFVARALHSVLKQTRPPEEIIVVDDGSTDQSCAVIEAIGDPRIRIIRQPNGGPAAARNTGIAQARGELLALLDADDEWYPTWLEAGVSAYKEAILQRTVGLVTSYSERRKHGSPSTSDLPTAPWSWLESFCGECKDTYPVSSSAALIPAAVLKETGVFDTRVRLKEDVDLWIRISLKFGLLRVNQHLSIIHDDDPTSITKIPRPREIPIDVESICRHFHCNVDDIPSKAERDYAQHTLFCFCRGMLKYRRFDLFDAYIDQSRFTFSKRLFLRTIRTMMRVIPASILPPPSPP